MAEELKVSPEEGAPSGSKLESGSQSESEAAETSNSSGTPYTYEQIQQHYNAAQNQSLQNYQAYQAEQQRRLELEQRLQQLEAEANRNGGNNQDNSTVEAVKRLHKSWETDDYSEGAAVLDEVAQRAAQEAEERVYSKLNEGAAQQSRAQSATNYLQQYAAHFQDPSNPVTQRMSQLYDQMHQAWTGGWDYQECPKEDVVPIGTGPGAISASVHLLRRAHEMAMREVGAQQDVNVPRSVTQSGVGFTEPSGTVAKPASKSQDVTALLSEGELGTARMFGKTPEEYFENLPERNKAARKEAGHPVAEIPRD